MLRPPFRRANDRELQTVLPAPRASAGLCHTVHGGRLWQRADRRTGGGLAKPRQVTARPPGLARQRRPRASIRISAGQRHEGPTDKDNRPSRRARQPRQAGAELRHCHAQDRRQRISGQKLQDSAASTRLDNPALASRTIRLRGSRLAGAVSTTRNGKLRDIPVQNEMGRPGAFLTHGGRSLSELHRRSNDVPRQRTRLAGGQQKPHLQRDQHDR